MNPRYSTTLGLACLGAAQFAQADNLPRDYTPVPAGKSVLNARAMYAWGDALYARRSKVTDDFDYASEQLLLRGAYYGGEEIRWGVSGVLPLARVRAQSARLGLDENFSGLGDPYVIAALWPLRSETFFLALSGWLFVPVGDYDKRRPLNLGVNAWSYKGEVNLTWKPAPGWVLEATAASKVFFANHEFGARDATQERAPLNTLEMHFGKNLRDDFNLSLGYYFHWGSETKVDGVSRENAWNDHAAQLAGTWRTPGGYTLGLWYRNDFVVRNGPTTQAVGINVTRVF